ncbi:MAG: hypothetical protein JNK79_08020 [Chitinophagaceae bacterium]|nr:hypothetical protein [Chitinophagaceae bacterium]
MNSENALLLATASFLLVLGTILSFAISDYYLKKHASKLREKKGKY